MMQIKTVSYYNQKAAEVLKYINNHIGTDLNIKILAERFNISYFHFHRIMRAFLDVPLGEYIDLLRLETALKLLRYSGEPLIQIANNIGYSDLSSFSKAFSKEFGISPTEFRNDKSIILNTHIDYRISDERRIVVNLKPKLMSFPDKKVCCITVTGKYGSEETYKAWEELGDFAAKNRIIGWRPELYAIYYDDPDLLNENLCSSDICIAVSKDIREEGRVKYKTIKGSKCLVFRYKGPYQHLWDIYDYIYRIWILKSDYRLSVLPPFEKYLNYSDKIKPDNLLTEIYLPIQY
jgi:AraC family transcriptional regulator